MAITVYIDGRCPMCVAGALRFRRLDGTGSMRFVNMHEEPWAGEIARRFAGQAAQDAMRVQMPDGTWRTGWFAWAMILASAPAWRWLGRLMGLPVFYGVGPAFYRWVAAHRQTLSKLLRLPPPCNADGVCRLDLPAPTTGQVAGADGLADIARGGAV